MRDGKAFASLSAGLLARKGEARPAMRRQAAFPPGAADDLGWNDMGEEDAPRRAGARLPADLAAPMPDTPLPDMPPVVRQQQEIARVFGEEGDEEEKAVPDGKAAPGPSRAEGRRVAFTLRLDTDRHLRLRLACAVRNRSAQSLVTEAIDRMLESPAGRPDMGHE